RIGRGRRPSDPVRRHVTLEDVELVFPQDLAAVRVETHDALLEVLPPPGRVLQVDVISHHNRRGTAAEGHPPEEIRAIQRPFLVPPSCRGSPPTEIRGMWPECLADLNLSPEPSSLSTFLYELRSFSGTAASIASARARASSV